MEPDKHYLRRLGILFGIFCVCSLLFGAVLYDAQVVHYEEYYKQSTSRIAASETVTASRGIITDRNGKVLVSNRQVYTITFDSSKLKEGEDQNDAILRLIQLCEEYGVTWTDTLPISAQAPYTYTLADTTSSVRSQFQKFLEEREWSTKDLTEESPYPILTSEAMEETGLTDRNISASDMLSLMREYFEIDKSLPMTEARKIIGVRYELELRKISNISAYVFASDLDAELISILNDGNYAGVVVNTQSVREYNTQYAAHILGYIGYIDADDMEEMKEKGYRGDELVGRSGVELAFEDYLRGTDGKRIITTNEDGKITGEVYSTEPQPGDTVALTIDIDLQQVAEESLTQRVQSLIEEDGYTLRAGAAVVIEVGTGDVLAMASYPTYDPANYASLMNAEGSPLYNRATMGTYPPGSTFKMVTAVAALETGTITPSTKITDKGVYTYYAPSYTPACWIYRAGRGTHGTINVSEALRDSCNYFFYEAGRLTGIDAIDHYGEAFGLGQPTGIEISERTGSLDGPEHREEVGHEYYGGDLLQISIGQGENLFTPLQLANYVATLVDGGDRYPAHLLKTVKSYDNTQVVYAYEPEPVSSIEISGSTLEAVKKGMGMVVTEGTVRSIFSSCVVTAGAKTGSAQTSNETDNGVFVCFAPFDDPQIAVAVTVERGGTGTAMANVAVDIINAYFSQAAGSNAVVGEGTLLQ
mgnify:FL=1